MAVDQVSTDILRILGLEETDEIDMESYKGFLREKLTEISMGKGGLSREEEMAVRDEFQRVRGKERSVKIKKTKINPKVVFGEDAKSNSALVKYKPNAPGFLAKKLIGRKDDESDILNKIDVLLQKIWGNLSNEEKENKKKEGEKKKKEDKLKKSSKESSLESTSKKILKGIEKTFKPVVDIFKKIRDTIMLIILGWAVNRLFDWISNPKNKKTFDAIVDFLSRNAGKLLLLFVALNNPLVRVIRWLGRNMISFLVKMIRDLTRGKSLVDGVKKRRGFGGRRGAAAASIGLGLAAATESIFTFNQASAEETSSSPGAPGVSGATQIPQTLASPEYYGGGAIRIPEYSGGAKVLNPGLISEGPVGKDQIDAKVTKGEFISSKSAVDTWGVDFYEALNKLGGGTNQPTMSSGRRAFAGGGLAIDSSGGGRVRLSGQVSFSQLKPHHGTQDSKRTYGLTKDYVLYSKDNPNNYDVDVPTPVDAVVKYAGNKNDGYGNSVELIDESGKLLGLFAHFNKLKVSTGQKIKAGKSLGVQGYTGSVSPPGAAGQHLHIDANPSFHEKFINYITAGKAVSTSDDSSAVASSPEDTTKSSPPAMLNFSSEEDRRLASAYLQYITQPVGRGLDILPTIDRVTSVPTSSGGAKGASNEVPPGSARNPNAAQTQMAAARRGIGG